MRQAARQSARRPDGPPFRGPGSSGERVALEVAATAPDRVSALVLLCALPESCAVDIEPATLGMPALVVGGGHDLEGFMQTARHLTEHLPRVELVLLSWAGHLPSRERPDEVSRMVGGFLDRELRPDR